MKSNRKMKSRLAMLIVWYGLFGVALVGCQREEASLPLPITKTVADDQGQLIFQQEQQKARTLLSLYFGGELKVEKILRAPAGAVQISAENIASGAKHTLYMLPDQRHLIDGVLYSPQMTADQVSEQHSQVTKSRAAMNDNLAASKSEMRKKIAKAISENKSGGEITKATKDAVKKRVSDATLAKRAHNDNVVSSMTPGVTAPTMASLPRHNTVVDKESIYQRMGKGNWISAGKNKKKLYVFYDFQCPACAEAHKYLEDHIAKNDVEVRYLPVSVRGPESLVRASLSLIPQSNAIRLKLMKQLARPEPIKTLIKIEPSKSEQQQGHQSAMQNFKLLLAAAQETEAVATPTFLYRTNAGAQISVLNSKKELDKVIKEIVDS